MLVARNPILTILNSFFICFSSNINLTYSFHLFSYLPPFLGRGSTNSVAAWYRVLTTVTKAYIRATSFEPIIRLLLERSTSAILVQSLVKRWWDTAHTFHIANREMTVTPCDFHYMIGVRCDGALINLEGESSIQLGIDFLRRRYTNDMIRYFNIKMDYKPFL